MPSLFRAGQVIVVGDQMQLPPTNFFSAQRLDEEETLVDSDDDAAVVDDVEVEEESSDFADIDADVEGDEETDEETETTGKVKTETVVKTKLVPAAPWGALPVVFHGPATSLPVSGRSSSAASTRSMFRRSRRNIWP